MIACPDRQCHKKRLPAQAPHSAEIAAYFVEFLYERDCDVRASRVEARRMNALHSFVWRWPSDEVNFQ